MPSANSMASPARLGIVRFAPVSDTQADVPGGPFRANRGRRIPLNFKIWSVSDLRLPFLFLLSFVINFDSFRQKRLGYPFYSF
jgi:hypothetical protein